MSIQWVPCVSLLLGSTFSEDNALMPTDQWLIDPI